MLRQRHMSLESRYRRRALMAKFALASVPKQPPQLAVGALGGSGTRAIVTALQGAGVCMGTWIHPESLDSLAMRQFLRGWFEPLRGMSHPQNDLPDAAVEAFREAIMLHTWRMPKTSIAWGWKNPRNMWIIPFLAGQYPGLRFIHLIRDGRAMATSNNRNLLRRSGERILGADWNEDPRICQLRLWMRGNLWGRRTALGWLGEERYLAIRYEDFCDNPGPVISRLLSFLEIDLDQGILEGLTTAIRPSPRRHNWKREWMETDLHLDPETMAALELFGYPESVT